MRINHIHVFKLKQLFFIILYWVLAVRTIVFFEVWRSNAGDQFIAGTKGYLILQQSMLSAMAAGFAIGLFTGLAELYWFQQSLRRKPLLLIAFLKFIIHLACFIFVGLISIYSFESFTNNLDVFSAGKRTLEVVRSSQFGILFIQGTMMSLGINFILIFKNYIGSSVFFPLLFGRYHTPREEDRIFLFIDLRSSTQMAENLGHMKYSSLVQDCFSDLSELVVRHNGAIYQFVGDQAVVTWSATKKRNFYESILLYFTFKRTILNKSGFYKKKYGVVPAFKAALNSGNVMAAQVGGEVKSEIAYHGDVLNTASRMMDLCKTYQKDLILSENIVKQLDIEIEEVEIEFQDKLQLRGKDEWLNIFSACPENGTVDKKELVDY